MRINFYNDANSFIPSNIILFTSSLIMFKVSVTSVSSVSSVGGAKMLGKQEPGFIFPSTKVSILPSHLDSLV